MLSIILRALAMPAGAATFVVDSTGDEGDADSNDGACATSVPACTLRAAIEQANASAGADIIEFDIPGAGAQLIQPATVLPASTGDLTIVRTDPRNS